MRKRAIITYTDLEDQSTQIEWQYDSDRYISDFHIMDRSDVVVKIRDDGFDETSIFVKQGSTVIWENISSNPVTIYSGNTTLSQFLSDPDLTLYGKAFKSPTLEPGDRYQFKFESVGEFGWFIHPDILVGSIDVTKNRISSRDQFVILESDGLESPFSSRVMKVDAWGNAEWVFGEGYLVKPRDARPLLNKGVLISC